MKTLLIALTVIFCALPSIAGNCAIDRGYTSGSDILLGRSQALSNEALQIMADSKTGGNEFYIEEIRYLREENKYLRDQIDWMRGFIDLKKNSD